MSNVDWETKTPADMIYDCLRRRHRRLKKKLDSQGWVTSAIDWHKAIGAEEELNSILKFVRRNFVNSD